jgi:hypothetical protein
MAIYTDRGNPVEIVDVIAGDLVRVRLVDGGGTLLLHLSDLRADAGRREIDAALTRLAGVYGNE